MYNKNFVATALDFSKTDILVVGDLMLDQYWNGNAARISPEAPVPVVLINKIEDRIGGAGNVAANIAAVGGQVKLFAYAGMDAVATTLTQLLVAKGVAPYLQHCKEVATTTKIRVISQQQQLIRLDLEQTHSEATAETQLLAQVKAQLATAQVMVLSDYAKGVLVNPQPYIELANKHGVKVIVDPKQPDFSAYKNAAVITPNLKEFQAVVGPCASEEDIIARGVNVLRQHNIGALVVTCGADGMLIIQENVDPVHIPAQSGEVYDVTGAGDTVVAILATALAAGMTLSSAAYLATIAAGIVVSKVGTAAVSLPELSLACSNISNRHKMQLADKFPSGIVEQDKLVAIIQQLQSVGEKIVFTNGCYDVLHHGHINYLTAAKALGDRLIVGVNTDASVAALKGPNRPVNTLQHRMEVLAGLKAVDWVVAFAEATPGQLVDALGPDVLVKTDEHFSSVQDIPPTEGVASVLARGGEVKLLSRTAKVSSTDILAHI